MTSSKPLSQHTRDQQVAIIARAWSAIGLKAGSITDELMEEWFGELGHLYVDEIRIGVERCKELGRTAPSDEFAGFCRPDQSLDDLTRPRKNESPTAAREKARMRALLAGQQVETREESMRKLELHRRWGV